MQDTVTESRELLAEAKGRAVGEPVAVQPAPAQHDPAAALVETRNEEVAAAELDDRLPAKDYFALIELAEDFDTLGLYGQEINEAELVSESVVFLEVIVDHLTKNRARLLVVMEPFFDLGLEVVLRGTRELELGVHQLFEPPEPIGITRLDRPVHADEKLDLFIHSSFSFRFSLLFARG